MIPASLLGICAPRNLHRYISPLHRTTGKYRDPCFFSRGKAEAFRWWIQHTRGLSLLQLESPLTSRRARTKFRGRVKLGEEIFRNLRVLFYGWRFKWKKPCPPLPLHPGAPVPHLRLCSPIPSSAISVPEHRSSVFFLSRRQYRFFSWPDSFKDNSELTNYCTLSDRGRGGKGESF